jgi:DNA polymerase-1
LLFRAFTTLPPSIVGPDGQPINAVYGMLGTVLRIIRDLEVGHAIAAFDVPEVPTFRHEMYPGYQAQRGPLGGENSADFMRQVGLAREILPGAGVGAVALPGFEADDIMGTLAWALAGAGRRTIVVSTDRDLLQLVRANVEVLIPGSPPREVCDESQVREVFGVAPEGVTTFKALAGDASDNVPGVRSIGKKTAADLVNSFGTLENIYSHLEELPGRVARALEAGQANAFLYREVVTIRTDLALPVDLDSLPEPAFPRDASARTVLDALGYGRPEAKGSAATP